MSKNLGFQMEMEGEALDALARLVGFSSTEFFKIISHDYGSTAVVPTSSGVYKMPTMDETPLGEVMRSYKRAWAGGIGGKKASSSAGSTQGNLYSSEFITPTRSSLEDGAINSIYRAVKAGFFGTSKIGALTGNTLGSMKTWQRGNTLFAGIEDGSWPFGRGYYSQPAPIPFENIKDNLLKVFKSRASNKWNKNRQRYMERILSGKLPLSTEIRHIKTLSHVLKAKIRAKALKKNEITGNIVMEWGSGGFDIIWPQDAKERLGIKDIHISSEPFQSKQYGKPGQTMKDRFFTMSAQYVEKSVMPYLDRYIETLWLGPQTTTDKAAAKLPYKWSKEGKFGGGVRKEYEKATQPGEVIPTEFTREQYGEREPAYTGGFTGELKWPSESREEAYAADVDISEQMRGETAAKRMEAYIGGEESIDLANTQLLAEKIRSENEAVDEEAVRKLQNTENDMDRDLGILMAEGINEVNEIVNRTVKAYRSTTKHTGTAKIIYPLGDPRRKGDW